MKKNLRFLNRILLLTVLTVLVTIPQNLTQAQGPIIEEPGASPDSELTSPLLPSALETQAKAFSGGPRYDSGWINLGQDQSKTLVHNLGGIVDDYVVDLQFRGGSEDGINLRYYGGVDFGTTPAPGHLADDRVGAYWRSLNTSSIIVYRRPEDTYAAQVRIRIWIDTTPDYDSDWINLTTEETRTLTHNLNTKDANVDHYIVDMQFKSATSGVNQRYFSGCDFGTQTTVGSEDDRVGAYWRTLTNTSITVFRRAEDTYAEQVRIRIWARPVATYDSGWVTVAVDTAVSLAHNIGGPVDDYQVVMDFKAADANGINQRALGGMDVGANPSAGTNPNDRVGAYWRSLSPTSIVIYRRPNDDYAPQIRIRIFRYWQASSPNYDSGWQSVALDGTLSLFHNLGGDANTYMVELQYRGSAEDGINLRYYGGADFGAYPAPGHSANDRVGAYWRSLTNASITVYRRPQDTYASEVRVRIWKMPKPDYNSGWVTKSAGEAATVLTHNLGGDYQMDYLVYFDYKNTTDGINQRYFGGKDFGTAPAPGHAVNDRVGADWRQLTSTTVSIYRRPEDTYAEQLRVRIWRVAAPDYSSGWVSLDQNEVQTLTHNLDGLPNSYLVQMVQWDGYSENTLNQRHFGGADFGSHPPSGSVENDRVGAYWRSLTGQSIVVYRRPEDLFADYVLVRIWELNRKNYLPIIRR